jgi:hypothetical protein
MAHIFHVWRKASRLNRVCGTDTIQHQMCGIFLFCNFKFVIWNTEVLNKDYKCMLHCTDNCFYISSVICSHNLLMSKFLTKWLPNEYLESQCAIEQGLPLNVVRRQKNIFYTSASETLWGKKVFLFFSPSIHHWTIILEAVTKVIFLEKWKF